MTVTGTVTSDVSKRITSPSTVSPSVLIFVSVVIQSSAVCEGSVFVGFESGFTRPDCARKLNGMKKTLKSRISDSLCLNIKILVWKCAALGRVVFLLWRIDAAE